MKVLVVGGGGREHALVWSIKRSAHRPKLFCAPGNAGISQDATCVDIKPTDVQGLADFARSNRIDMTIVGPEAPLVEGIVDAFKREGLPIFGPTREAAMLEGSKAFTKDFCRRHGIPQAEYEVFEDAAKAKSYVESCKKPTVVKANGLAAGKGVIICETADEAKKAIDDIMLSSCFGGAGKKVVIEEFLGGEEASFIAVCDGASVLPLAGSKDHKRALDGDRGPNTGGMGAISPAPVLTQKVSDEVMKTIMTPAVRGMAADGMPFVGVLYAGLMIDGGRAKLLEFNVRFGDPETEALIVRLKTDIVDVFEAAVAGSLGGFSVSWDARPSACVVMASGGYPGKYEVGKEIIGLEEAGDVEDAVVFHAGTRVKDGRVVTAGGRVLCVSALGKDMKHALQRAYSAVSKISWDGVHYRRDIGRIDVARQS
jgi:phosphoribosylamine--glycine ligase